MIPSDAQRYCAGPSSVWPASTGRRP
ncbi:hypothetical protein VDGL01_03234 [Verticillium dahliae]